MPASQKEDAESQKAHDDSKSELNVEEEGEVERQRRLLNSWKNFKPKKKEWGKASGNTAVVRGTVWNGIIMPSRL